jgi:dinuclear metal center YbgI/SA1388 family protein
MKVGQIAGLIDEMIPLRLAQGWDNVGLLVGRPDRRVGGILVALDVTPEVVREARAFGAAMIVAYHPVIWDPLKAVTSEGASASVYELARSDIAVFCVHTALDSAAGGVNDGLAEIVGIENAKPLGDYVDDPAGPRYKLVVFVPPEAVPKVTDAVFRSGAGVIGNYSRCGFQAAGEGSFLPGGGASPAVGRKGRLERVREIRFETVVEAGRLGDVVAAMLRAHPYETPAYDVFRLHESPGGFGLGRMGALSRPASAGAVMRRIKKGTGAAAVGVVGEAARRVATAAVCAGSCGRIINRVIAAGCDLYVTGELKHHHALAAAQAGLVCVCLGHGVSERFILKKLAGQLRGKMPKIRVKVSARDVEPLNYRPL